MSLQWYGGPSRNTWESGASRHDRIAVHADLPAWYRTADLIFCCRAVPRWLVESQWLSDLREHIDVVGQPGEWRWAGLSAGRQRSEASVVIEATLAHALITSQVRRMRPRVRYVLRWPPGW